MPLLPIKKIYLVIRGKIPGIYTSQADMVSQTQGFPKYIAKGFKRVAEAIEWWKENDINGNLKEQDIRNAFAKREPQNTMPKVNAKPTEDPAKNAAPCKNPEENITVFRRTPLKIYTDGSILSDGRSGGWAGIVSHNGKISLRIKGRKKAKGLSSEGMELFAIHKTLKYLEKQGWNLNEASVYTDCQYIQSYYLKNVCPKGKNAEAWAKAWKRIIKYNIAICWVKGHAGNPLNEECDKLAKKAANEIQTLEKAKTISKKKFTVSKAKAVQTV